MSRLVLPIAGVAALGVGLGILLTTSSSERHEAASPSAAVTERKSSPGPPRQAAPRWVAPAVPAAPAAPRGPILPPAPAPDVVLPAFGALIGSPQIDPRKPGYDPVAAYELMGGGNVRDLFVSEPRADPWAGEREADLARLILPELQAVDPDVRVEAECRTATCRLRLYSEMPALTERLGEYPLSCLASKTALMSGTSAPVSPDAEEPVPSFFLVFRRETLDRVAFLSWIGDMCPRERAEWRSRGLR